MSSIVATALQGIPPTGIGIFTRDRLVPGPWKWYAVDPRIRGGSLVREALERGPVWLFLGPDAWTAENAIPTLQRLVRVARELGATGILANPERGWQGARAEVVDAFAQALIEASRETRIGIVTIPSWGPASRIASIVGRAVWWSPEFYSQSVSEEQVAGWWSRWRRIAGSRLIPTIAAFRPPNDDDGTLDTPEGYARYLDSIPAAGGVAVWPVHPIAPYMLEALSQRYGGVRSLAMLPFATLAALDTPAGMSVAAIVAVIVVIALFAALRRAS